MWPEANLRFSDEYFSGRWVSIFRLIAIFLQLFKVKKNEFAESKAGIVDQMDSLYCYWSGGNILSCIARVKGKG